MDRVRSEMREYDVNIITETHMRPEEREEFERKFNKRCKFYYAMHETDSRNGVVVVIQNGVLDECEIKSEVDDKEGRWVISSIGG